MKQIIHWIPAAFCAFLSLMPLLASSTIPDSGWWRPAFYAFLPMCFVFGGTVSSQLQREIRDLRAQVAELQQKQAHPTVA
ncbi:MAG: hypothetical protein ABIT76_15275 [Chthoniobacterales bacterium]